MRPPPPLMWFCLCGFLLIGCVVSLAERQFTPHTALLGAVCIFGLVFWWPWRLHR